MQKAGLGSKKIKFYVDDDEKTVIEKITSDELDAKTGDVCGFPKLKNCGGFKLMHCVANCRTLSVLECASSVTELKANVGSQSKIYLRPIKKDLSTAPVLAESVSEVTEKCHGCGQDVLVRKLRKHIWTCSQQLLMENESDGSEEPPQTSLHTEAFSEITQDMPDSSWDQTMSTDPVGTPIVVVNDPPIDSNNVQHIPDPTLSSLPIDDISSQAVDHCIAEDISDPVEILRYYQSVFVTGRQLDISDPTVVTEGATNYILVDRGDILSTAFDEIKEIEDLWMTFQVQFYN